MKTVTVKLVKAVSIVLLCCSIAYYFIYNGIITNEQASLLYLDEIAIDLADVIIHTDTDGAQNISYFVNKHVIPYYPDIWNQTPWSSFHFNFTHMIHTLHAHEIETVESMDFITQDHREAQIRHIHWDDEIPSHYMTCSNLSLHWQYPQGIPALPVHFTSQFDDLLSTSLNHSHELLSGTDFSQLIDFDALCLLHTPGFFADNTIFNKQYFYGLTYEWMGNYRCWANKTMDFLCNTSLSTCSKQGTVPYIIMHKKPVKVINIAFRLTGWGATAFSHFHIFDIPQFAMIYNILVAIKIRSTDPYQVRHNPIFYNISLVTNLVPFWHSSDIKTWFFAQFGLSIQRANAVTSFMNVTVVMSKSWCRATNNVHWSPLVLSPHFLRYKEKYEGAITMRWKLLARNTMLNIKPFITDMSQTRNIVLYLDRGFGFRRGVRNNDKVMAKLSQFVENNQNRLEFEFMVFHYTGNRQRDKELFSKVAIVIGPHGGAMANINLLQPGSYVVEFVDWWSDSVNQPEDKWKKFRPCYYALSQAGGMNYFYLKPPVFNFDRGAMAIDLGEMIRLMETVYHEIETKGFKYL